MGKGITFDTGGISIKPAEGMERMKDDMAGGAAVIGAMRAISLLQAPIKVVGIVPASENMPGGRATKPGDVLTGAGGKTVEVLNTDAEGRLILGDGLWYAQQPRRDAPRRRRDADRRLRRRARQGRVGTLRRAGGVGRERVARGRARRRPRLADAALRRVPRAAAQRDRRHGQHRRARRPAPAPRRLFLKEFAGGLPWAHLDIAGTAWADEAKPWQPKGPTGVAVRTLAELAFTSGEWK